MLESAVAQADDMGVVGRADSVAQLWQLAVGRDADVVIVGLRNRILPSYYVELLLERPRMKVLAIEELGGRARLYELRPERVELGDVSPGDVVEAIRAALTRSKPF